MAIPRDVLRSLRRSPTFFLVAVLSLGLALGIATTTYAVLDVQLNPTVPFDDPDQLLRVGSAGDGAQRTFSSFDRYVALRNGTQFHAGIALTAGRRALIEGGRSATADIVWEVNPEFFTLLGVSPEHGRLFGATALDAGSAIISYDVWRRWFGQAANLTTLSLRIDTQDYGVIGVMPPYMTFPFGATVWLRLPPEADLVAERRSVMPIVRLKPGETPETARAELLRLARDLTATHGVGQREFQFLLSSIAPDDAQLQRSRWLYNVPPTDVTALVVAELALIAVSVIGCAAPRAAGANPLEVLRAS